MVWTTVPVSDRVTAGIGIDSVESVIDAVRVAQEAEVAVVLKEHEDGTYRVSMRSRGHIDVAQVNIALGGGGHRYAAGYTATCDLDTAMANIRAALAAAPHLQG
jgi:phosphoesterase RecJ-like protein